MAGKWRASTWGDEISLEYGKALRGHETSRGPYRIFGSNGPIGWTDEALAPGPGVILGRKGAYRGVEFSRDPFFVIDTAYYVVPKSDLDMQWLYYAMRHYKLGELDDGSPIPSTTRAAVYMLDLDVPPPSEQRAIAHILGTLDDKIELNRRMSETLETMARALFKSWFVDFDPVRAKAEGRDPGLPQPLADLFPARLVDSELGEIPEGWSVSSLGLLFPGEIECVLTGPFGSNLHAHDYRDEGVPLILVKHVANGQIHEDDLPLVGTHKLCDLERYRLSVGDIVFTRVGAVGRTAYVNPAHAGWLISGQLLRVRVPHWQVLHPRYLAQVFLERSFIDMVEGHALGTTRPSLNTALLQAFRFLVPAPSVMASFASQVAEADSRLQAAKAESRTLATLRNTLLPKLISGELRVNETRRTMGRTG